MSKARAHWWSWVRAILYNFRDMADRMDELNDTQRRELQAVVRAMGEAEGTVGGQQQIEIVRMVFFDKTHTLSGAALHEHISYRTARRRQNEFIRHVGKILGLS